MQTASEYDGQIAYDLEEFCKDYGHPSGQLFTFEVTCNAVTYAFIEGYQGAPEPATWTLIGSGFVALGLTAMRRSRLGELKA